MGSMESVMKRSLSFNLEQKKKVQEKEHFLQAKDTKNRQSVQHGINTAVATGYNLQQLKGSYMRLIQLVPARLRHIDTAKWQH